MSVDPYIYAQIGGILFIAIMLLIMVHYVTVGLFKSFKKESVAASVLHCALFITTMVAIVIPVGKILCILSYDIAMYLLKGGGL